MITPSIDQIEKAKTWTELFVFLGVNPRNDRLCFKIKTYVRENFPNSVLSSGKRNYKISDEDFIDIVKTSLSIRQALKACGISALGGSYKIFHKRVKELDLDTSHFLGKGASKGKKFPEKSRDVMEYLELNGPHITTYKLKLKLISSGIKTHQCEMCFRTEWNGKEIPLELDHINGSNLDNRIENLRVICPNCHAQTDTYRGKNKKLRKQ